VLACAASAAVLLAYVAAVGTSTGLSVDASGLPGKAAPGPFRTVLFGAENALGPASGVIAALAIVLLASRRSAGAAVAATVVLGGTLATAAALEALVPARDALGGEERRALGAGYFPSGHAAAVMALTLASVLAAGQRLRLTAAVVGATAASLLGIGNLATHAHHPSDVFAGFLIAGGWAAATAASLPAKVGADPGPRRRRILALGIALLVPLTTLAGYALEQPASEIPGGFVVAGFGVSLAATAIVASILDSAGAAS
jgi:membrane-associated phospholipid phosphatase